MSGLAHNASCVVCHSELAKWLCKCANEAICQGGPCLAAHFSKTTRAHVLVEYEVGAAVSSEQTAQCFQSFDRAVGVAEYIKEEISWLRRRQIEVCLQIDEQTAQFVREINEYAQKKKEEVGTLVEKLTQCFSGYSVASMQDFVLEKKRSGQHLCRFSCSFSQLKLEDLISLPTTDEKEYKFASNSASGWNFNGPLDAITVSPSKNIEVRALCLSKANSRVPLTLKTLEIRRGSTTRGTLMYSHNETVEMQSQHPYMVVVKLHEGVIFDAGEKYTIRVLLEGGTGHSTGKLFCDEQNGLAISTSKSTFEQADRDNGSSPSSGVFFEIRYIDWQ